MNHSFPISVPDTLVGKADISARPRAYSGGDTGPPARVGVSLDAVITPFPRGTQLTIDLFIDAAGVRPCVRGA